MPSPSQYQLAFILILFLFGIHQANNNISSIFAIQCRHGFFQPSQIFASSPSLGIQSNTIFGPVGFQANP